MTDEISAKSYFDPMSISLLDGEANAEANTNVRSTPIVTAVMSRPFNLTVQGYRGLSAMMVFFFHVLSSGLPSFQWLTSGWIATFLLSSEYGVELFFCISGFAIATALQSPRKISYFLRDRAIRIYPVLWATLSVITLLGIMFHKAADGLSPEEVCAALPAAMLALPGVFDLPKIHPAAWSLSYEWGLYVIAAGTVIVSRYYGRRVAWCIGIVAATISCFYYPRALFFICGVLVIKVPILKRLPRWLVAMPGLWLLLFLALWRVLHLTAPGDIEHYNLAGWGGGGRICFIVLAFILATVSFVGLVQGHGQLGRLLRSRVLLYLGRISYSFYLWHVIVMAISKHVLLQYRIEAIVGPWSQLLLIAVALPMSLFVARISHNLLERRASRWLHSVLSPGQPQLQRQSVTVASVGGGSLTRFQH